MKECSLRNKSKHNKGKTILVNRGQEQKPNSKWTDCVGISSTNKATIC